MHVKPKLSDNKWIQRLVVWGALIILWEIAAVRIGPLFLPRVSSVVMSMVEAVFNGDLLILLGSMRQMLIGFMFASVVGTILGLLLGISPIIDEVLGLYVRALFVTSLEALLPFLIILFGTQFNFRVAVVFLFALFHIVFNTAAGVRSVNRELLEMAAAFNSPRRKILTEIVFPAIFPYAIAGLHLGLGNAFKGMIIAELWVVVDTGKVLVELGAERRLSEFLAFAGWIIIFGLVLTKLLNYVQQHLTPWHTLTSADRQYGV
jgi:ABC-type nitrate/sulfonate/bicarbonate transport system permease component